MKKYVILGLLIVSCLGGNLNAQNKPFIFGFKIAPNASWMKPDTKGYENDEVKMGFSWGFMVEFHLMENYKINSGINIIANGGSLKYPEIRNKIDGELIRKYNLKYIQIPLALKMKTNSFGKKSFYGIFGFGTNFLLSAKANETFSSINNNVQTTDDNIDILEEMKLLRMSLVLGIGMEYELRKVSKLIVGINFDNGIFNVLKGQNTRNPKLQHKSINNFLEIYVGILF